MPRKKKQIIYNVPLHKHHHLFAHIGAHFMIPTFVAKYNGISNELNIRKTKYYKSKGGQTINLQKEPYFKELIKKIKISVLRLSEQYYKVRKGYKVDVVSMWLNSNEKNRYHPPHNHQNTFISGVIWLDGERNDYPSLKLLRPYALPNLPIIENYNEINSNVISVESEKDKIIFFPSYLYHYVDKNLKAKPRISIAFDTILRGPYGEIINNGETVGQYKI
mgnify:FL=1|jgi:uncharacterized protein (TIGR02466 family)